MINMLSQFIERQLKKAKYKILEDRTYFGEIPGIKGVWANTRNLEDCRKELREVLEDWLLLKIRNRERVSGFKVKVDRRRLVKSGA
jgi:predicted RNase H-like HicB family nuclease